MMDEHKAAMYLVAIVGIVAAVGILVLLIGNGVTASSESDLSGQAISRSTSSCCDGHANANGDLVCDHYWGSEFCRRQMLSE